jgi:hypothetical protein
MDSPSKFDLTAALRQWRENLAQSPEYSSTDLEELESHLRDSIDALARNGLPLEAAFSSAQQRFGNPSQVAEEFAKAHPGRLLASRLMWFVIGLVLIGVTDGLISILSSFLKVATYLLGTHAPQSVLGFSVIANEALAGLVVFCVYYRFLTTKFELLERLVQWAITHPKHFIGLLAVTVGGLTLSSHLCSIGLLRLISISSNIPGDFGKTRLAIAILPQLLTNLAIGLAPLLALIHTRLQTPIFAPRRPQQVATISVAWIVTAMASLAMGIMQCCYALFTSYVLINFFESRNMQIAVTILIAMILDLSVLICIYRFVRNDFKLFKRFETLVSERPKRLLAEMTVAGFILSGLSFFTPHLWLLGTSPSSQQNPSIFIAFNGIAFGANLLVFVFVLWIAFQACHLSREIQQNVPRGTFQKVQG